MSLKDILSSTLVHPCLHSELQQNKRCFCWYIAILSSMLYLDLVCTIFVLYCFVHYDYFNLLIPLSYSESFILQEWFFRVSSWWRGKEEMGIYIWEIFWLKLGKFLSGKPHIHFGTSLSCAITISSMWFNSPHLKGSIL